MLSHLLKNSLSPLRLSHLTGLWLCSIFILSTTCSYSQGFAVQWDTRLGANLNEIIAVVRQTPGGELLLAGTSFSGVAYDKTEPNRDSTKATSDYWIILTDNTGQKIWDKSFGGNKNETLHDAILTTDGGYLLMGQSYSDAGFDKSSFNYDSTLLTNDIWVVKTDASGNKIWDRSYGGYGSDLPGEIIQTPDGGYLFSASTLSDAGGDISQPSQGSWDYWVVKTDATGNIQWEKRFGGNADDFCNNIVRDQSGYIYLGGYSRSSAGGDKTQGNQGSSDYWIVMTDSAGNKIRDINFGGSNNDWLFDLQLAPDGGLILGGQSFSPVSGDKTQPNKDTVPASDRWLVRTDTAGVKIWDMTFGGALTDDLRNMVFLSDSTILISGESYSGISGNKTENNLGVEQTWLINIDLSGNVLWDKTLFTYGHDEKGYTISLSDDCFVIVNYTQSDTGGYKSQMSYGEGDFWMIQYCRDSLLSTQEITDLNQAIRLYPNPSTGLVTVQMENENTTIEEILITDMAGRRVLNENTESTGQLNIDLSRMNIQTGWYVIGVKTERQQISVPLFYVRP